MKLLVLIACLTTIAVAANFKASLNRHTLDRKTAMLRKNDQRPSPKFGHRLNKGSAPVTNYLDSFYVMNISVGTPPQVFQVLIDPLTANLWLVGEKCVDPECDGLTDDPSAPVWKKHKYYQELSSTFETNNTYIANGFSSYPYYGILDSDDVTIAGITVKQQVFANNYQIADIFGYWPIDGVFGLAWQSLAIDDVVPPFFNMIPQLDQPIFTLWLDPHTNNPNRKQGIAGGQITFGAIDTQNCDSSSIVYSPLTAKTYWQVNLEGISFGAFQKKSKWSAAVSISTFLYGPTDQVDSILRIANAHYDPDQDTNIIACDAKLPDLTFTINGHNFSIQTNELILDIGLSDNKCALAIYGMYSNVDWILTEPFLRSYCTVYDAGNLQVGFAKTLNV